MKSKFSINQKWTVVSTILGQCLTGMDGMFLSYAMMPIVLSLGVSKAAGGVMGSITTVGMLIGAMVLGPLADTFGRVRIYTYTLVLAAFAASMMYFATNIYYVYALRFLTGCSDGAEFGIGVTLIMENFKYHEASTLESYIACMGDIGGIVAAIISSLILPYFGWRVLFLCGLIPIFLAFFVRLNLKENSQFVHNITVRKKEHHQRPPFSKLFSNPRIAWQTVVLIFLVIAESSCYFGIMNWLPSMMQQRLHVSVTKSSLWMVTTILGMCAGMIIFVKIMNKWGPRSAFVIYSIGAALLIYSIALANGPITLLIACTFTGFFACSSFSGFGVIISKLYPMSIRATANSFILNCGQAIGGLSPIAIGAIMDNSSLIYVFGFLSILNVISVVVVYTLPNLKGLRMIA